MVLRIKDVEYQCFDHTVLDMIGPLDVRHEFWDEWSRHDHVCPI